jgi:hypothetical protein
MSNFKPKINKIKKSIKPIKKVGKTKSKKNISNKTGLLTPKMKNKKNIDIKKISSRMIDVCELVRAEATNVIAYSPFGEWYVILHYEGKGNFQKLIGFKNEREAQKCENEINKEIGLPVL